MYENRKHRIDNRIVSVSQPHVRPIKRGKEQEAALPGTRFFPWFLSSAKVLRKDGEG
ncbi:hypothetical protein [Desulfogranum marinum]|uniref:hypothetical protein n=1 Tax=Desulfogranum marinum TaxID=453220 RepID=UPI0019656619|nr:hypothetical protein [Desulfogranum marinum]MBM9513116.1 hypothetical protein [Desulfogranum marinum]